LVRSHAAGVGDPFSEEEVRALMLLRANVLAKGLSGARPAVAERLCDLLNHHFYPVVPCRGSVGASGDLAPLAHLALVLIGEGEVARRLSFFLRKSEIRESHINCERIQDAYSLRCMPQVHGPVRECLDYVKSVAAVEMNSATDNPLVFADGGSTGEVLSGGNFHGQSLGLAFDFMTMSLATLANISERRIERLLNPEYGDLPPFLADHPGLNSGFMIAQVAAAALASENKVLSHPASVDSIPTSGNKEDHVPMAMDAALKLKQVVANLERIIA